MWEKYVPDEHDINVKAWGFKGCEVEECEEEDDECIPGCEETIKPYIGQLFDSLDEGVRFYKEYAAMVGVDVRCSTMRRTRDGDVGVKYLLYSREGYIVNKNEVSKSTSEETRANIKTRQRVSNRVGCTSRCVLRHQKAGYYAVTVFKEIHNHRLCSQHARPFLKINRNMEIGHQAFIILKRSCVTNVCHRIRRYVLTMRLTVISV